MNWLLVTAAGVLRFLDGNPVAVVAVVTAVTLALCTLIVVFGKQSATVRRDLVEIVRILRGQGR